MEDRSEVLRSYPLLTHARTHTNTQRCQKCTDLLSALSNAKPLSTCNYTSNNGRWMRGLEILPTAHARTHTHKHTALSEVHRSVVGAEQRQATYEHMSTCRHACVRANGTYPLKVGGGKRRRNPSHAHKELLVSVVAEHTSTCRHQWARVDGNLRPERWRRQAPWPFIARARRSVGVCHGSALRCVSCGSAGYPASMLGDASQAVQAWVGLSVQRLHALSETEPSSSTSHWLDSCHVPHDD